MTRAASHSSDDRTGIGPLGRVARDRPIAAFVVLTIAWSWGYWVALGAFLGPERTTYLHTTPGLWGPLVAAVAVTWASGANVRTWVVDSLRPRVGRRWYALSIGIFLIVPEAGRLVAASIDGTGVELGSILSMVIAFPIVLLAAGALEEFGLRGFVHPRLRDRHGTIVAGALVGVPWAVWHLPLLWLGIGFGGSFPIFLAAAVPISIVLGWLYDAAGESVAVAMVGHAAVDTPGVVVPTDPVPESTELVSQLATVSMYWLLVGVLVVLCVIEHGTVLADARPADSRSRLDSRDEDDPRDE